MATSQTVKNQQIALNKQGANLKVDGILGPLTKAAIAKTQTPYYQQTKGSLQNYEKQNQLKNQFTPSQLNELKSGNNRSTKFKYGVQKKPQISQRDSYAKAMNKAQKNGGSNGIGVGM